MKPKKLNRWLVFEGSSYYFGGGWEDFFASYASRDLALAVAECLMVPDYYSWGKTSDWVQVVDRITGEVLDLEGERG